MPNFFGQLLGGMLARKYETDAENRRQGELASQREQAVFTHLLNADDPDTRNLALAGLLDSANPRRKAPGLRGWIGETLSSPYLAKIQALSPTITEQQPETIQLPGETRGIPGPIPGSTPQPALTQPPTSAGMPPTSPVQPGAPPPTPTTTTTPAPQWATAPPTPYTFLRTVQRPRQAFLGPTEKATQLAGAKEVGDIGGMRAGLKAAGFADDEAAGIIRQHLARKYAAGLPYQHVNVEVPDGKGGYIGVPASYDRSTGQYLDDSMQPLYGARLVSTTASKSLGVDREAMIGVLGYQKPLTQEQAANVEEAVHASKNALTLKDALGFADRFMPNKTQGERMAFANLLLSQSAAMATPGAPPSPTSVPNPQSQIGGTVESPSGAPPAPTTAPTGKPKGITLPPSVAGETKETGKPLPSQVQQAMARTRSMNDTIDRALAALTPYKNSTNLDDTMKIVEQYRMGTEGSPLNLEAAQLSDLAGLQQAASTTLGGASRSQRIYADKRQHTPRLPSGRQIMYAHGTTGLGLPALGAERVQKLSQLREGDTGGFDAPSEIYNKLVSLKKANDDFLKDITEAAQPVAGGQPGAAPGSAYKDANGVWHIRQ